MLLCDRVFALVPPLGLRGGVPQGRSPSEGDRVWSLGPRQAHGSLSEQADELASGLGPLFFPFSFSLAVSGDETQPLHGGEGTGASVAWGWESLPKPLPGNLLLLPGKTQPLFLPRASLSPWQRPLCKKSYFYQTLKGKAAKNVLDFSLLLHSS